MIKELNNKPVKNPFKVPENYFEEVNRKIISATSGYEQKAKKVGLFVRFKPYFLIAASVTGFILLSYTALKLLTPNKTDSNLTEVLINEDTESYLNDIDIVTLEENTVSLVLSDERPEVNKSDIIDYLLSENIEISDIYEQL
ncbi:MAG: hypothetical protein EPN88_15520 [Bacteroidetes bacterium]|nr:MAG: hypothetical protein EPN88_15520 [Bacteroidota bacterium]